MQFCNDKEMDFMSFRVWIAAWTLVIALVVVAFEASVLVRYFTRFTEEIFAVLIAFIFLMETWHEIERVFEHNPISDYLQGDFDGGDSSTGANNETGPQLAPHDRRQYERPNTALFSLMLILATFLIAVQLRKVRNSKFLGRSARRAVGDYGVPIAIITCSLVDFVVPQVPTQKLELPDGLLQPTSHNRSSWLIDPFRALIVPEPGAHVPETTYLIALIPALLIFILLFVEVEITE